MRQITAMMWGDIWCKLSLNFDVERVWARYPLSPTFEAFEAVSTDRGSLCDSIEDALEGSLDET